MMQNGNQNANPQGNAGKACCQWDDQHMVEDMLDTAKHIASTYGSYIVEGSNQEIRKVLTDNMDEVLSDQFKIFEQMHQRGWYQTKPAQQPDIMAAKEKFTQEKNQLM